MPGARKLSVCQKAWAMPAGSAASTGRIQGSIPPRLAGPVSGQQRGIHGSAGRNARLRAGRRTRKPVARRAGPGPGAARRQRPDRAARAAPRRAPAAAQYARRLMHRRGLAVLPKEQAGARCRRGGARRGRARRSGGARPDPHRGAARGGRCAAAGRGRGDARAASAAPRRDGPQRRTDRPGDRRRRSLAAAGSYRRGQFHRATARPCAPRAGGLARLPGCGWPPGGARRSGPASIHPGRGAVLRWPVALRRSRPRLPRRSTS